MEKRYMRNMDALTQKEWEILHQKKIFVAGCGGLGGHIIDMLLRIGVGSIVAVDGDVFEESNLNRQLLSEVPLVGTSKAKAAEAHAASVNPDVNFIALETWIDTANAKELITGCDVVMDALDTIETRKCIAEACSQLGIPMIHGAVCGWTAQAAIVAPGGGLLHKLYPADVVLTNKTCLSFTPPFCASMQVALCVALLCKKEVQTGKVYYADILHMDF